MGGEFTTSLGDANPYAIAAITTDSAGNTYVVGSRQLGGGSDVFVSKLDPNGKLLFTDTFAGKCVDTGNAIALDPAGNIYIAAVVPMGTTPNAASAVHVVKGAAVSADYPVWVLPSAAQALPTVSNQDGTLNSQTNPAKGGSIVTFYGTSWQSSFYQLMDGQVATSAQNICEPQLFSPPTPCQVVPATGVYAPSATVLYGGPAPGIVAGVTQFNVQIGPVAMSNFAFQISFSITDAASIAQTVWVAY